jgi:hypothetical protein
MVARSWHSVSNVYVRTAIGVAATIGALFMLVVLWTASARLAYAINPLGMATADWLPQMRGLAPPANYLIGNAWLVITCGGQCGFLAWSAHKLLRRSIGA